MSRSRNTAKTVKTLRELVDDVTRQITIVENNLEVATAINPSRMRSQRIALQHALAYIYHHQRYHDECSRPIRERKKVAA